MTPVRDGALARGRALLIARLVIGLYLVELLLNLTRPHVLPNEPTLSIFQRLPKTSGSFGRLLSIGALGAAGAIAWRHGDRTTRARHGAGDVHRRSHRPGRQRRQVRAPERALEAHHEAG